MKHIAILALILCATTALAQGQGSSASDLNAISKGRIKSKTKDKDQSQTPNPEAIRGHCTVVSGGGNLAPLPCPDTVLILNDRKGGEVMKARTDRSGNFEFSVQAVENDAGESHRTFKIVSGTRFYDVVSPKDFVHTGQTVDLQLRQK